MILNSAEFNPTFLSNVNNGPLPLNPNQYPPPPIAEEKEFDCAFCTAELENQDSYILIDILRDV